MAAMLTSLFQRSFSGRAAAVAAAVCMAGFANPARAHHSLAEFLGSDRITIEGTVTQFRFINPHASVALDVTGDGGETEAWTLVMDDRWELVESGFSRHTFQPGDELIVTGRAGRVNRRSMYVSTIERPADGFVFTEEEGEIREGVELDDLIANSIDEQGRRGPPSFAQLDSNRDGTLSADELTTLYELLVLLDLSRNIAPSEDAFFAVLDGDGSGAVTEEEYDSGLAL